ncbi:MAG: exosortase C-terminal domain/associated protein EpsI [Gemmatimonadaceae bacterium]
MPNMRPYLPAAILALGVLLVAGARGQRPVQLAGPIDSVLPAVDGYRVRDQKIGDEERRVAGMSNYVARMYSRDSMVAFTILVSYYDRQTRGESIHSPRNCLPGAGWEVLSGGTQSVTANGAPYTVNRYILKNGPTRAVVYYWYQGRGRVVASEYAVKWNLLKDAAFRGHTEEALVRVVVPVQASAADTEQHLEAGLASASALGSTIAGRLIGDVDRILPRPGAA